MRLNPQGEVKSLRTALTETGAPSIVQIREFDRPGSLEDTAQNESGETERNETAPMLHRIRENGLFSVKTQPNRHFGWLFNHQTPFPHAAGEARVETKSP